MTTECIAIEVSPRCVAALLAAGVPIWIVLVTGDATSETFAIGGTTARAVVDAYWQRHGGDWTISARACDGPPESVTACAWCARHGCYAH